jgi:amylosucrase
VPSTGDSRISGTFASLAGLEIALETGDPAGVDAAIERMRLGHALILAWDGVPLLYMGDELAMRNDDGFRDVPEHAADSRWLHRPLMDWALAARRHDAATPEGRAFADLRHLIEVRRRTPELHASVPLEVLDTGGPALFAFERRHPGGALVAVHNMTDAPATTPLERLGLRDTAGLRDLLDAAWAPSAGAVDLPPRGVRWLVPGSR